MFPNKVLVVVLMHLCLETAANKYCEYCDVPGTHTMCQFPDQLAKACLNYRMEPLKNEEKLELLKFHNEYRNRVARGEEMRGAPGPQPPAADMRQMSWDDELALIAKRWADQCISINTKSPHDKCRDIDRFLVGQNIATDYTSPPESYKIMDHVMRWYDEVNSFNKTWIHSFGHVSNPNIEIGHYTQFVWSQTYLLGCERVRFDEYIDYGDDNDYPDRKKSPFMVHRVVCNYGPAGNLMDDAVYRVGAPCSMCPKGTSCNPNYGGICATSAQIAHDKQQIDEKMEVIGRSDFNQMPLGIKDNTENKVVETTSAKVVEPEPRARSGQTYVTTTTPPNEEGCTPNAPPIHNYNKGVWINGGCYCPVEGRSAASKQIPIHISLYITAFMILIVI